MSKRKGSKRKRGSGESQGASRAVQSRSTYWFLRIAPVVVTAIAATIYFAAGSAQGAAVVMVFGAVIWLAIGLGSLGAQVPPRDGSRPGAIEFGKPTNPK